MCVNRKFKYGNIIMYVLLLSKMKLIAVRKG